MLTSRLKGKTALIIGASNVLGAEIVKRLGKSGANLVLSDIRRQAEPHPSNKVLTADYAEGQSINQARYVNEIDLKCQASVKNAYEAALEHFGSMDLIINNSYTYSYSIQHYVNMGTNFRDSLSRMTDEIESLSLESVQYLAKSDLSRLIQIFPVILFKETCNQSEKQKVKLFRLSDELKFAGVKKTFLWPKAMLWTEFAYKLGGFTKALQANCRKPVIVVDAIDAILSKNLSCSYAYAEDILTDQGITDLQAYNQVRGRPLLPSPFRLSGTS